MKARNPILPLQYYCPDGEPHLIGDELFVYPSFDTTPGEYCCPKLYVAHSRDLEHWSVDGPVFDSGLVADWPMAHPAPAGLEEATCYEELPQYIADYIPRWFRVFPFAWFQKLVRTIVNRMSGDASKRLLYAPDSVTIGGKSYLFFCTSDGREGVAVSDSPAGPFRDPVLITGDKSSEPVSGIDPAVFRDDDGKVYLYWGQIQSCGAELTDDLTKIKEDTLVRGLLTELEHGFHEGSSMRKLGIPTTISLLIPTGASPPRWAMPPQNPRSAPLPIRGLSSTTPIATRRSGTITAASNAWMASGTCFTTAAQETAAFCAGCAPSRLGSARTGA